MKHVERLKQSLVLPVIFGLLLSFFVVPSLTQARSTQVSGTGFSTVDVNAACHEQTSSRFMRTTRKDRHVPCDCKPFNVHQFKGNHVRYFVQGIRSTKGADEKIDLNRDEARMLWRAFNPKVSEDARLKLQEEILAKGDRLADYVDVLTEGQMWQGFKFSSEGDVLEALAIAKKEESYPLPHYFVTGGIAYGKNHTEGELDIVVFERATCKVIEVGEAKLGKGTNDARKQLARFRNFVN
ncbi:MAG: hypothetical protein M9899_10760 [Bdellovibrionaceae bacterium]|nr:hypothetical protein [Pseudobdellovibrionaceae bacterium]